MFVDAFVTSRFAPLANPENAQAMQAYMKTTMPFWGIKKPDRAPVLREVFSAFKPVDVSSYEENVRRLWSLPHREEKYVALEYAKRFKAFVSPARLPLYETLIREGAWWDFVDDVAVHLVGKCLLTFRQETLPGVTEYVASEDLWLRRTSLLMHNRHRAATDEAMLFATVRRLAPEKSFWIRKAIGWALREYAAARPERVVGFLTTEGAILSGLSIREAKRPLVRMGLLS